MLRISYFLLGLFCALIGAEVLLRALPVATEYGNLPVDSHNPVLRGTPNAHYVYSKNWNFRFSQSGILDEDGYIGIGRHTHSNCKVLLIGNSYVEAAAIDQEFNMASILTRLLKNCRVQPLAKSGDSLADYLARADWGVRKYDPQAVMFLLVDGDIRHAYDPHSGGHYFTRNFADIENRRVDWPGLHGLRLAVSRLRVFRYLWYNLNLPSTLPMPAFRAAAKSQVPTPDPSSTRQAALFVLDRLEQFIPKSKVIFLVDAQRSQVSGTRDIDQFAELAEQRHFQVLRLQDAFDEYGRQTGQRLDLRPIDWHWNEKAQLVASRAALAPLRALLKSADDPAQVGIPSR